MSIKTKKYEEQSGYIVSCLTTSSISNLTWTYTQTYTNKCHTYRSTQCCTNCSTCRNSICALLIYQSHYIKPHNITHPQLQNLKHSPTNEVFFSSIQMRPMFRCHALLSITRDPKTAKPKNPKRKRAKKNGERERETSHAPFHPPTPRTPTANSHRKHRFASILMHLNISIHTQYYTFITHK